MSQVWHTDATVPAEPLNVCGGGGGVWEVAKRESKRESGKYICHFVPLQRYVCLDVFICVSAICKCWDVRSCINTYVHH